MFKHVNKLLRGVAIATLLSCVLIPVDAQRPGWGTAANLLNWLFGTEVPAADTTKFYVKNGGDDAKDGLSDANAWKTTAKVNGETFDPGDEILFNKGDTWRETDTVSSSGTVGNHITYGAYGSGDNPRILGSELALDFTAHASVANVWGSSTDLANPATISNGSSVWFEETDGTVTFGDSVDYDAAFLRLIQEHQFTWQNDSIYVYAASDPDIRYSNVEAGQRTRGIYLYGKEYITIDGIDIFYTVSCIDELYPTAGLTGLEVRNCELAFTGEKNGAGYGLHTCYNNAIVEDNVIHHHGRRGFSLINYDDKDISNIVIQDNVFYNSYHTTGVDIETGTEADDSGDIDSIIIRRNHIYNDADWATNTGGIFLQENQGSTGKITSTYIYNNLFENSCNDFVSAENTDTVFIYNNTFYGQSTAIGANLFFVKIDDPDDDCLGWEIKNNIFYQNKDISSSGLTVQNTQDHTEIDVNYNLYYHTYGGGANRNIINANGTAYQMADWETMKSDLGYETNGPVPIDPLIFTDSLNVKYGSSAIDSGLSLASIFIDDYYGVTRSEWNIGGAEIWSYGDTAVSFIASKAAKQDSVNINVTGFISQPENLLLVADEGLDSIGPGGGTILYNGSDTTALQNVTLPFDASTDTAVRFELYHTYHNIQSYFPNTDSAMVDSLTEGYEAEFQAVYDDWTTPPHDTLAVKLNTMVKTWVDGGQWAKLDVMHIYAIHTDGAAESLVDWINPGVQADATNVSATTFTAYEGYTGDGSADYINWNWNPNDDGSNYTQNSASMGGYARLDIDEVGRLFGSRDASQRVILSPRQSNTAYWQINNASEETDASANATGMWIVVRTASDASALYRNGSIVDSDTDASVGLPSVDVYSLSYNSQGSSAQESTNQIAMDFAGGSLTEEDITAITDGFKTYMTSNGK